jgi:threonine aldolase
VNFASDNAYGASRAVLDAIIAANDGPQPSYGSDAYTKRAEAMFSELFERDVAVFLLTTGTAANALALAEVTPSYRAALCHAGAHVMVDECGATEFYTGGSKLIGIQGDDGKITAEGLADTLANTGMRPPHDIIAASLSLTQATEFGTVYGLDEIAALTAIARERGLKVHMDGARFANAVVSLGCTAAQMTWKAGIDVLTFGATKNGALAADALIFFEPGLADSLPFRRMQAGHLWSKGRYLGAQFCAMLEGDLWLDNARHANAMAQELARSLTGIAGIRLACPCQANEVFVILPRQLHAALGRAGAVYHEWSGPGPKGPHTAGDGEVVVRMVTSFTTARGDVERLVEAAGSAA